MYPSKLSQPWPSCQPKLPDTTAAGHSCALYSQTQDSSVQYSTSHQPVAENSHGSQRSLPILPSVQNIEPWTQKHRQSMSQSSHNSLVARSVDYNSVRNIPQVYTHSADRAAQNSSPLSLRSQSRNSKRRISSIIPYSRTLPDIPSAALESDQRNIEQKYKKSQNISSSMIEYTNTPATPDQDDNCIIEIKTEETISPTTVQYNTVLNSLPSSELLKHVESLSQNSQNSQNSLQYSRETSPR